RGRRRASRSSCWARRSPRKRQPHALALLSSRAERWSATPCHPRPIRSAWLFLETELLELQDARVLRDRPAHCLGEALAVRLDLHANRHVPIAEVRQDLIEDLLEIERLSTVCQSLNPEE